MKNGLSFKGFFVSGKSEPMVYNGKTYYNVEMSDGDHTYNNVRVGSDQFGKGIFDKLQEFEVLYDGIFQYNRGNLVLVDIVESKFSDPVPGLSIEGIRCSAIPSYEHVSKKDGLTYYSATFSDGVKSFSILLGSGDEGKKLRDSLKLRQLYSGSVIYLQNDNGKFLLAQELRPYKVDKNK